jgi:glycosyltransferase involved in cell wall biosynthesis
MNTHKKKKIIFLTAKMSLGGAERVISNLVNSLSKEFEVHTILLLERSNEDYVIEGKVHSLYDGKARNRLQEIFYYCYALRKYIEKNNIDITISFMEYPNLLNILTPVKTKKITSVRNHMSEKWVRGKGLFWKMSIRFLYPFSDLIISPTKVISEDLINAFKISPKKIALINNPYGIEKIEKNMIEDINPEYLDWFKGFPIITMGNLNKAKGHHHLIRAFARVSEQIPNAKLIILGEGPGKENLVNLTTRLNLDSKVLFLGFQKNPHKFLAKAKIYVLSSYYEGFPNALVEAMICNIPVISTDCKSGPREILAPNTDITIEAISVEEAKYGILIPRFTEVDLNNNILSFSEDNLYSSIMQLHNDVSMYNFYQEKSKQRAKDFHADLISSKWVSLIESMK